MCFNSTASLSAFTIGMICSCVMIYRKMYMISTFYFFIVLMQLLEYFAHITLENNHKQYNQLIATGILFLLFLQPVVFTIYAGWFKYKDVRYQKIVTPLLILFSVYTGLFYLFVRNNNNMKINYMKKQCVDTICRLDWIFFKTNVFLSLIFILFYFFFYLLARYYFTIPYKLGVSFDIVATLLVLSLVYMVYVDGTSSIYDLISGFGSIWCILAVLIGPYMILSK